MRAPSLCLPCCYMYARQQVIAARGSAGFASLLGCMLAWHGKTSAWPPATDVGLQGSTPHSSAAPAAEQPGLVGQTTGAVGEVGSRVYDTGAAAVGVAGSAVGQTAGIASSATSSLFGAVKGLGMSVAGSADKSRQQK